jgi:hypothetical protein
MLNVICCECHTYTHHAECYYAEFLYAECGGTYGVLYDNFQLHCFHLEWDLLRALHHRVSML